MRRSIALCLLAAAGTLACADADASPFEGEPYGEALTLTEITPISAIHDAPEDFVGRRVLVEGQVVAVCESRGCWIDVESDREYEKIQIKVEDGVIVFPMSLRGRTALVEGTVEKLELTHEEAIAAAEHRAEEQGVPFDPESVTGPETIYRIRGIGALVRDAATAP
ncbi:MAG: DUF4920 domain-containing protein [Gemmatimonadetes bacterium]|nr:DUF4920 domain-containing protein [Gemmatimonadota bacterium]NNK62557.1 DUF4920 domain-containing protein [Gemmatimonadota bacterium]